MMQAGHETTANMISLGTVALLQHRDVFERLGQTDDRAVIANIVEELMRYLTIVHSQVDRVATEDLTIGGQLIRAGDMAGDEPARRELGHRRSSTIRKPSTSTEIPAGTWVSATACTNASVQNLARVEMQVAFATLARRVPGLRLAVSPDAAEVQRRIRHLRHERAARHVVISNELAVRRTGCGDHRRRWRFGQAVRAAAGIARRAHRRQRHRRSVTGTVIVEAAQPSQRDHGRAVRPSPTATA